MVRKMISAVVLSVLFVVPQHAFGQANITDFSPYWKQKVDQFRILPMNAELEKLAAEKKVTWVNLAPFFKDESGQLKTEFTKTGFI
jgi:hypothetical protein